MNIKLMMIYLFQIKLFTNFRTLIYTSLFRIFNENEVNLHILEIEFLGDYYSTYFEHFFELILKNEIFLHNIRNLKLYTINDEENMLIKNHLLQIINLHYLKSNLPRQVVNLNKPFKLKSIFINKPSQTDESLQLLLQKSGDYLENFNLNYLSIDVWKGYYDQQGSDYILHYIREFIMKEKRVKYLAFNNEDNGDLFNLENEVEEFKLQNVSIRNIYDLFLIIGSHGFIKNI
ncbi:hypothetical protein RclHR1_09980008 [Rhizophagus clarus]|uniref:Uncharacterized protein n=1 Tax=Rhizophagus clarus TaxID=94130 RepID=A0A2Z6S675_9GLOM|nr:hypothetical protein RclHR1_09980008 [Rhizophagus clarus]